MSGLPFLVFRAVKGVRQASMVQQMVNSGRINDVVDSLKQGVTGTVGSWRDPAAKFRRRLKRARMALWIRFVIMLAIGLVTALTFRGGDHLVAVFIGVIGLAMLVSVVGSARLVWRLQRTPLPEPPPALPPSGSVVRRPMEVLDARERTLAELLMLLGPAAGDTAQDANAGATAIRERSRRVVSLENARADAPGAALPELDQAIEVIAAEVRDGVRAYERLVAAAASAVSAAGGDPKAALTDQRLRSASDALSGLASGFREVDAARGVRR